MSKVIKLQNSVKEASERKEIYIRRILLKMLKGETGVILIGFEFREFEVKTVILNSGNNDKRLNVHVIGN